MLSTKTYHLFNVHKLYSTRHLFAVTNRFPPLSPRPPHGYAVSARLLATPTGSGRKEAVKVSYVDDEPRLTHTGRLKRLVANYGATAVGLHIVYSLASLGSFYCLIHFGFEDFLISRINTDWFGDQVAVKLVSGTGTFAVAYALHKMIMPLRVGLTVVTTPAVAARLRKWGVIKAPKQNL